MSGRRNTRREQRAATRAAWVAAIMVGGLVLAWGNTGGRSGPFSVTVAGVAFVSAWLFVYGAAGGQ